LVLAVDLVEVVGLIGATIGSRARRRTERLSVGWLGSCSGRGGLGVVGRLDRLDGASVVWRRRVSNE